MISITTVHPVPVLEPGRRTKDLRTRITSGDLGGSPASSIRRARGGWLINNTTGNVSDRVLFPCTFVPDENVVSVEGTEEEILAAYGDAPAEPPKAKRAKKADASAEPSAT